MYKVDGAPIIYLFFFFNDPATPEIYPLSLPDALPISFPGYIRPPGSSKTSRSKKSRRTRRRFPARNRSEEHTSELQSQSNLVCRLLLEKKKPPQPIRPNP